jgi:hypothetical protein
MRALRVIVSLIVLTLIISSGSERLVVAQSGETGVFGLTKDGWDESLGDSESADNDLTSYQLEGGGNVYIRFDDEDQTIYVEYVLPGYLTFNDAEKYSLESLLPKDVEFVGEHQNLLGGGGGGMVSVLLYQSDAVARAFSGNSGVIVFTYGWDLGNFSVSIG